MLETKLRYSRLKVWQIRARRFWATQKPSSTRFYLGYSSPGPSSISYLLRQQFFAVVLFCSQQMRCVFFFCSHDLNLQMRRSFLYSNIPVWLELKFRSSLVQVLEYSSLIRVYQYFDSSSSIPAHNIRKPRYSSLRFFPSLPESRIKKY